MTFTLIQSIVAQGIALTVKDAVLIAVIVWRVTEITEENVAAAIKLHIKAVALSGLFLFVILEDFKHLADVS